MLNNSSRGSEILTKILSITIVYEGICAWSADLSVFYSLQSYFLDIYEVHLHSWDLWQPME